MTVLTGTRPELSRTEAYEWCRSYTKARASNFYYAFSVLPGPKRHAIHAAYAFSGLVDDIADELSDAGEQARLLNEARLALSDCYSGYAGEPIYQALADAITRFRIPRQYFDDLIDGVSMDITVDRYETWEDLEVYCRKVASTIGLICTSIFGTSNSTLANLYAIDLGIALQIINIMRDVVEDAARGRIYFPQTEIAACGLTDEDILSTQHNQRFISLMHRQAQRAHRYLESGRKLLPMLDLRSRMCVNVLQGVYSILLARMEERHYDVISSRVRLSQPEKLRAIAALCLQATREGRA